jgi:excisionase family DNA binding protein
MSNREKLRKDYFTRREAAKYAGVCEETIKRLAQKGRLKKYRQVGLREVLFAREELDAVLKPRPVSA